MLAWHVAKMFGNDWIRAHYLEPKFHFTYAGFDWIRPLPDGLLYTLFALLGLAAIFITVGFCYRAAVAVFALGFSYVFLLEKGLYLNHVYLLCLLAWMMLFIPLNHSFSLDARLRPGIRSGTAPAWTLWLLRTQIGIVFVYGGLAKINADWLQGEPMRTWMAARTDFPLLGQFFTEEWAVYSFSYGGMIFDLAIVPLLLWQRTRLPAYVVNVLFHLSNAWLFPIGIFPWFMIAATTLFFPPEWPRRFFGKFLGDPEGTASLPSPSLQRVGTLVLLAYLAIQLVVPLRHYLYPGNPGWTMEGHYFSWHMRLNDKRSGIITHVTEPATGKTWTRNPNAELPVWLVNAISTNPDMIRQYCRKVAAEYALLGTRVEVRAEVVNSLNGRALQPLIDASVDLASMPRSLGAEPWIVPLTEALPAR